MTNSDLECSSWQARSSYICPWYSTRQCFITIVSNFALMLRFFREDLVVVTIDSFMLKLVYSRWNAFEKLKDKNTKVKCTNQRVWACSLVRNTLPRNQPIKMGSVIKWKQVVKESHSLTLWPCLWGQCKANHIARDCNKWTLAIMLN